MVELVVAGAVGVVGAGICKFAAELYIDAKKRAAIEIVAKFLNSFPKDKVCIKKQ